MWKTALLLAIGCSAAGYGQQLLKARLSLTDTQLQTLQSLREQHLQCARPAVEDVHNRERALHRQLRSGSMDTASIGKQVLGIEASRKRAELSSQAQREQAVATLTPEQRARLKTLEEAQALLPAIREAEMLGLLARPDFHVGEGK